MENRRTGVTCPYKNARVMCESVSTTLRFDISIDIRPVIVNMNRKNFIILCEIYYFVHRINIVILWMNFFVILLSAKRENPMSDMVCILLTVTCVFCRMYDQIQESFAMLADGRLRRAMPHSRPPVKIWEIRPCLRYPPPSKISQRQAPNMPSPTPKRKKAGRLFRHAQAGDAW